MTVPRWLERARSERLRRRRRRRLRLMAALALAADAIPKERAGCILRHRLDWAVHKQTLLLEGQFQRCYRMSAESFERLLSFIRPALVRDELQSRPRTGTDPISPEMMLQMTISWLAGSRYHTTRNLGGTSVTAIYITMHAVMDAICDCPELIIRAPTESAERMYELADGFKAISKDSVLTGCVGCIDGWLCEIRAPSAREVPDVAAFFSGHYQKYGLNVQVICDSLSRFTGYCFNSPGKKWKLQEEIMQLPAGFYIIGDNVYPLSDSLMVPFSKLELKSKAHSDYNFYLSQLCEKARWISPPNPCPADHFKCVMAAMDLDHQLSDTSRATKEAEPEVWAELRSDSGLERRLSRTLQADLNGLQRLQDDARRRGAAALAKTKDIGRIFKGAR
ncbi:hypothetical protein PHYSODRAFT_327165 [Phytophthora sojae]|uniref:DDE Tnp4 domain-containing protein n=1 Tax=Phytophthora sojae (strain P6497) TaxID=1094619 RepID=G4YYV9_PHYSP|nr:hypothetical protein PHYSODRAFT_327165 [Phytophthora sojae]EGZ26251.1 hypothetical protein PHYSODRAFT_327165 [Phytophthora sojae]|eukprot:XP_009521539.1 hypothetical protein PHYSODRAFT_327165 [Phytophthora sojae]